MRVLLLYAHPVETSFVAAVHRRALDTLAGAGHKIDDCDLYAERFDPVLSRAERLAYHDVTADRAAVEAHVSRLRAAEALVLIFPVWNFGYPAILKGYFDRVFLPGVSFALDDGVVRPALTNVRRIVALATYGGTRLRAMLAGDPPRRCVTRVLRAVCCGAPATYLAHYDMNRSTPATRAAFLDRATATLGELSNGR